jgi:hypothetical protein
MRSMPVPQGPRRAAPPRKKAALKPTSPVETGGAQPTLEDATISDSSGTISDSQGTTMGQQGEEWSILVVRWLPLTLAAPTAPNIVTATAATVAVQRHRNLSPNSSDSYGYGQYHRSGSRHNLLPCPPKVVLLSTPFRPLLTQLPSTHYNSWGIGSSILMPQPQPVTYSNMRPRKDHNAGIFHSLSRRDQRFAVPSLSAMARILVQPFMAPMVHMSEPQLAQPPIVGTATPVYVPPVVPQTPQMHMPTPEPAPIGTPMMPTGPNIPMPNPAAAGSMPFVSPGSLTTPRTPVPHQPR